jgi:hypothetical protein
MHTTVPTVFRTPAALDGDTLLRYGLGEALADLVDLAAEVPRGAPLDDRLVVRFVDKVRVLPTGRRSAVVHTLVRGMHSTLLRALWGAGLGDRSPQALVRLAIERIDLFGSEPGDPRLPFNANDPFFGIMGGVPQPNDLLRPAAFLDMGQDLWALAVHFGLERMVLEGSETLNSRHLPPDVWSWIGVQATRDPALVAQNLFAPGLTTGEQLTWNAWEYPGADSARVATGVLDAYKALGAFEHPGTKGNPKEPGVPDNALLTEIRHVLLAALAMWPINTLLPAAQRLVDPQQDGDAAYAPVFAKIVQAGLSTHERMQFTRRIYGLPERERLWAVSGVLSLGQHLPYAQFYTVDAMRAHGILRSLFL